MSAAGYFGRFNPDLLALIPPDAKTVLEIGCGEGALAAEYRKRNPGVHWIGYEANREVGLRAYDPGRICDEITTVDVEECDWSDSLVSRVDCLVIGDVLEHLRDPWETLRCFSKHVKSGAQVLASIPNVQHWTVIRDLLDGKWDYADEGLMDRAHLRFFTRKTIGEMFAAAGLHVFEIRGRDIGNEGYEAWLAESGVKPRKEMRAYQYIVRALKKPEPNIRRTDGSNDFCIGWSIPSLHIHAVLAEACCARPRILEPFAFMATEPGVKCTAGIYPTNNNVDILIQQRFRSLDISDQCDYIRGQGSVSSPLIIAELDDDPESPLYLQGRDFDPMTLQAVHAVQVSTEPLAEIVRQFNPNVMVFPNQIAELEPPRDPKDTDKYPTMIFYGAQNRENDWAPIMPAINRIASEMGDRLFFFVMHDRKFFDALDTQWKHFEPFCEYGYYRKQLRYADIALLPLEPNRFNECKSDIKFLECAAEGVAVLASWTVYGDTMFDGKHGFLYHPEVGFQDCLERLIRMPERRRELATNAYAYVREHRLLSQHYRTQLDWYRSLLRSKEALHRDLLERVPALGESLRSAPVASLA